MQNETTELSERLRIAMKQAGLSQTALAKKIGVSQANVAFILSGRNKTTKADILSNMAYVLGVSSDWLNGKSSEIGREEESVIPYFSCEPRVSDGNAFFDMLNDRPRSYPKSFFEEHDTVASACKIFPVETDSMSPVLAIGDFAVVNTRDVDPWQHPVGHVYAMVVQKMLRFYRLTPAIDSVLVSAANSGIPPKSYDRMAFQEKFILVGRVIDRFGNGGL